MVYFKINGLGYNCGQTKDNCPQKAQSCRECVKKRLLDLGFEFDETIEVIKLDSGNHLEEVFRCFEYQTYSLDG